MFGICAQQPYRQAICRSTIIIHINARKQTTYNHKYSGIESMRVTTCLESAIHIAKRVSPAELNTQEPRSRASLLLD